MPAKIKQHQTLIEMNLRKRRHLTHKTGVDVRGGCVYAIVVGGEGLGALEGGEGCGV
jgi:hypothetical protein